jgi:hypothetical protein
MQASSDSGSDSKKQVAAEASAVSQGPSPASATKESGMLCSSPCPCSTHPPGRIWYESRAFGLKFEQGFYELIFNENADNLECCQNEFRT